MTFYSAFSAFIHVPFSKTEKPCVVGMYSLLLPAPHFCKLHLLYQKLAPNLYGQILGEESPVSVSPIVAPS